MCRYYKCWCGLEPPPPPLKGAKSKAKSSSSGPKPTGQAPRVVNLTMMTELDNREKPIPIEQNITFRLIYVTNAALQTNPALYTKFVECNGFEMIRNLVINDPCELVKKIFCEFVGYVQTNQKYVKRLHEIHVMEILTSFVATSKNQTVRDFARSIINSLSDETNTKTLIKGVGDNTVGNYITNLIACERNIILLILSTSYRWFIE